MTFIHLANLMQSWGYIIKPKHYYGFKAYLEEMLKRNRVLVIWNDNLIECVITYFFTNDYTTAYKKDTWTIPKEDYNGIQIYIDKMVCRRWTKSLRAKLQDAIEEQYPWVREAYYHRAPNDRLIKIVRGEKHVLQDTVS